MAIDSLPGLAAHPGAGEGEGHCLRFDQALQRHRPELLRYLRSKVGYALRNLCDDSYLVHLRTFWQLGAPEETPERWEKLSMTAKLPAFRAPVLMQMVEQEYLRSLDYAIPLIRDHRAELYVFPEKAHNKFQSRHKLAVYERNLDWFKFWLLDEQDPDPAKLAQYARWRVMKHQNARAVASGHGRCKQKAPETSGA